jgi:hypothetical protein
MPLDEFICHVEIVFDEICESLEKAQDEPDSTDKRSDAW